MAIYTSIPTKSTMLIMNMIFILQQGLVQDYSQRIEEGNFRINLNLNLKQNLNLTKAISL